MQKAILILILFVNSILFSQSSISTTYSHYDYTVKGQYEIAKTYDVDIDITNETISIGTDGYDKSIFKIVETNGPLYQTAHDSDDLYKYYQFETISNGNKFSIRYYLDKKFGLFIMLGAEGEKFMRHYNR